MTTGVIISPGDLDGSVNGAAVEFDVQDLVTASVSASAVNHVAWGALVVTLEHSTDGVAWHAFSPTAVTFAAAGHSGTLDVSAAARLRARVSTVNANRPVVRMTLCGKRD